MSMRLTFNRSIAMAGVMLPWPALAQTLGQGSGPDVAWWRVVGALALCLALAVGGAFALRTRMGGGVPRWGSSGWPFGQWPRATVPAARRLTMLESLRISPQVHICLVACDEAEFLVAISPQSVAISHTNSRASS